MESADHGLGVFPVYVRAAEVTSGRNDDMYTMTLNDGTKLEGLMLKGCALCRKEAMTPAMFAGKLNPVTIEGTPGDGEDPADFSGLAGTHEHMAVVYIREAGGEYSLALRDIPDAEYGMAAMSGDIAYIAMMSGIEL